MRKLPALILFACLCAAATAARQQGAAPKAATGKAATDKAATHKAATDKAAGDGAAARFKAQVEAISAGAGTGERRAAIFKRLEELGVRNSAWVFKHGEREGANIVADLPAQGGATKRLLLGAHYDRVAVGRGAVDNASGCAAVLELLAALKAKPLKNYSVGAVFFDLEEIGLLGSKAFVAADAGKHVPDVFVNFDVFGYGDALYVMAQADDSPTARAFKQAAADAKLPLTLGRAYPPSDHLSFLGTRAEVAAVSIVGADEIESITQMLRGERPERVPRALSIIHTDGDTPDKIDAAAGARAISAVERALRLLDSARP